MSNRLIEAEEKGMEDADKVQADDAVAMVFGTPLPPRRIVVYSITKDEVREFAAWCLKSGIMVETSRGLIQTSFITGLTRSE